MIIGLAGRKLAGKDTVAKYLAKYHEFEHVGFANKLKESVAALFDIPLENIEEWKLDPLTKVEIAHYTDEDPGFAPFVHSFTFREFLQRYGTEAHRDVFGTDFWVDVLLPLNKIYLDRNIAVSDVRFISEYKRIKILGGACVWIERDNVDHSDPHISEQELSLERFSWDYVINNNQSMEILEANVKVMLNHFQVP